MSGGTSSQAFHVADLLLGPPRFSLPAVWRAGCTSPFSSNMPQPAPWTCLCSLSRTHSEGQPHGLPVLSCPHAPAFLSPRLAHSLSFPSGCFSLLHSHSSLPLSSLSRDPTQGKTESCSTECKHLPEMMKAFCCQDIWFGGDS